MKWLKNWLQDRRMNRILAELAIIERVEKYGGMSPDSARRKEELVAELEKIWGKK